jgi:exonuclease III
MVDSRCGDLNVSHQSIDLANPSTNKKTAGFTQEERDDFAKILSNGFIDACKLKFLLIRINIWIIYFP